MNMKIKGKKVLSLMMRICLICSETTARRLFTTYNSQVCKVRSITEPPNRFKYKIFIPAT